jgi:hypothetical protein
MNPNLFRILALVSALGETVLAFLLRKDRRRIRISVSVLSFLLLVYKIGEGIYFGIHHLFFIPYEVSHLAYYVVPILLLLGFPGSDFAAGSLALISGVGFLLGAGIRPDSLIAGMNPYEEIRLLLTHELLFFLALPVLFSFRSFGRGDYLVFAGTLLCFLAYFLLLKYRILFPAEDFNSYSIVLGVLDGSLVKYLTEDVTLPLRILFATGSILLVFLVPLLILLGTRKHWERKKKEGKRQNIFLPLWGRYGLIPWEERRRKEKGFPKEEKELLHALEEKLLYR